MARPRRRDRWGIVSLVAFGVVLAALVWPLAEVLRTSLTGEGGRLVLAENYRRVFTHRYYYSAAVNSLVLSSLATVGAVLVGTPLAIAVARYPMPGKALIRTAANLALLSPPFIGAYSWVVLFGRSGLLNRWLEPTGWGLPTIYGYRGILLVFVVQYFPFVFLLVSGALAAVDQSIEDAALSLGSRPGRSFRTAILPVIAPSLTAGALLVFMATMADFGTPMLIGEGLRTLPTLMYGEFINELGGNPSIASTLGSLLILVNTAALMAQRYFAFRRAYHVVCLQPLGVRRLAPGWRAVATVLVYGVIGVALIPAATILVSSFMPTRGPVMYAGWSLGSYATVFHLIPRAIVNTFALTAGAVALDVGLGMLVAYLLVRRRSRAHALLDALVMLAYAIPGTVVGVGLIIVYNRPPVVLTGTWVILLVSYFIRHLPYPVRSCAAMLQQIDIRVEEASVSLGVPPFRTFCQVTVPLMLPAIVSGATLAWITTIGELSSSILLYSGPWATMSVEIFTQVFSNHFGTASALGSILIVAASVPLFLTYRLLGERSTLRI
ncbi:MAG: iron ABC transporter permease [Candidatus Rokubacteria bacterium]|nr:iron ABC transporter permease [Candidatus Rokubacteria bacterium]